MDSVFLVLLVAVAVYEAAAIVNKRRGDTISERNWDARDHSLLARMAVDSLLIWGFWHLYVDAQFFAEGASWVDLVVVGVAVGEAWVTWGWDRNRER